VTATAALAPPEQRLSTQPEAAPPGPPPGRTPRAWARLGWRRLTSMRTALQLLFILALAAVPGGLLPQRGQAPARVQQYLTQHRTLGPLLDRLSLFDVYAAPWFAAVYLLLFISLIGCLVPRIRLHARALRRRPPAAPARLARLPSYDAWDTELPSTEVADRCARLLRGWRTTRDGSPEAAEVAAERGYLRETGNLAFHVSLVALLAGIGWGSTLGYESDRVLAEGEGFTNTRLQLDQFRPGRFVRDAGLAPWTVRLDDFTVVYRDDGSPAAFDARMTYTPASGGAPRPVDVQVNHPLSLGDGAKLYLLDHGYAVRFRLTGPGGVTQTSEPVVCAPLDKPTLLSRCVVSFAGLPPAPAGQRQDLAFQVAFAPDGVFDPVAGVRSAGPRLLNPDLLVTPYVGDLGRPRDVYSLDRRLLAPVRDAAGVPRTENLVLRDPARSELAGLPGGYTLSVAGVSEWASFQVKRDPGKPLVLLAAIGILAGLVLSLRVRRRRLWLRATTTPAGRTLVEIAGLARSDAPASRAEFTALAARLRAAAPAAPREDSPS